MDTERCIVLFVEEIVFLEQDPAASFHAPAPCARRQLPRGGTDGASVVPGELMDLRVACESTAACGPGVPREIGHLCHRHHDDDLQSLLPLQVMEMKEKNLISSSSQLSDRCLSDWPDSSCPVRDSS
eukprot:760947-Hanusia_phi.AAC.3